MPIEEFWHEDVDLFFAYLKGYNRRIDTQAWLNGLYNFNAHQAALFNMTPVGIRMGMSDKTLDPKDHVEYLHKPMSSMTDKGDYIETKQADDVMTESGFKNAMMNINKM